MILLICNCNIAIYIYPYDLFSITKRGSVEYIQCAVNGIVSGYSPPAIRPPYTYPLGCLPPPRPPDILPLDINPPPPRSFTSSHCLPPFIHYPWTFTPHPLPTPTPSRNPTQTLQLQFSRNRLDETFTWNLQYYVHKLY